MISKVVPSGRGLSIALRDWADPCDYPKLGWLERIIFDSGDERSRRPCTYKEKQITESHGYRTRTKSVVTILKNPQRYSKRFLYSFLWRDAITRCPHYQKLHARLTQ